MCLVLKLDNGKVVSIASGQTHRVTQPPSTVLVYSISIHAVHFMPEVSQTSNEILGRNKSYFLHLIFRYRTMHIFFNVFIISFNISIFLGK